MKKRLWKIIVMVLIVFACQATAESLWIDSVCVVPEQPLLTDIITFNVSGEAAHMPSMVEYDQFSQYGTFLQLDLYVSMGYSTAISYWTYLKEIQPLLPATYSLEVRAFDNYYGTLQDTYTVDFTVTPEPATLVFLAIGLSVIRGFSRRKT